MAKRPRKIDPVKSVLDEQKDAPFTSYDEMMGGGAAPLEDPDADLGGEVVPLGPWGGGRRREKESDRQYWWRVIFPAIDWGDDGLPADCPVVPLGKDGETHNYIGAERRLVRLAPRDHSRNGLVSLFGGSDYLQRIWPAFTPLGSLRGFKPDAVTDALMKACSKRGSWSPADRVRGPGAHLGAGGKLILHCGDGLLIDGQWHEPGLIDGYLYPAGNIGPRPKPGIAGGGDGGPGDWILSKLETWNWKRPKVDALLMFGWLCAGVLGGALSWRPLVWVSGPRGTGKSTLQGFIRSVITCGMQEGIVSISDATAAGIWQKLVHCTYPVGVDEIEATADNRKVQAVVALARQAASGGVILRGGAEHQGREFTVRSCFLFSSILIPPLLGQDLSRLAILELRPLKEGPQMVIDEATAGQVGRALRARLVQQWARFGRVYQTFRGALIEHGKHDARGADQFGTLLAAAWVALWDQDPGAEDLKRYGVDLSADALRGVTDETADEINCKNHLLGFIDRELTMGKTVGELLAIACRPDPQASLGVAGGSPEKTDQQRAREHLARLGLVVVWEAEAGNVLEPRWLRIANRSNNLGKVFAATHWAAAPGAAGVWRQAFVRLPGCDTDGNKTRYFAGAESKCLRVPIGQFLQGKEEG